MLTTVPSTLAQPTLALVLQSRYLWQNVLQSHFLCRVLLPVSLSLSIRAVFAPSSTTIFGTVQKVYGAKDNGTMDKDNGTRAKDSGTGETKMVRLEYTTNLCQS